MIRLGVNIDHVATLREARKDRVPDPIAAAIAAEMAGADGIVCHLREDRRHIKDKDLYLLREIVKTHLNLEMAATDEMVRIATEVVPDMVTLVPERREEVTTEGGLDVVANHNHDIIVSLFIDADMQQIKTAARIGADYVELHTGNYAHAHAKGESKINEELEKIRSMAVVASKLRLGVSAGHGLNYHNVRKITETPQIEELNIGHAIVARAVMVGMERAARDMLELMK